MLFVDSDDYLPEKALANLVEVANNHPGAVFIKGNQKILLDGVEHPSVFASFRLPYANRCVSGESLMTTVLKTDFVPCNNLIKRKYLDENNIRFSEQLPLLEDVPFISEICIKAEAAVYSAVETYVYRLDSTTSLTRSKRTFSRTKSLIEVGATLNELAPMCKEVDARELLNSRSVELAISGYSQSCRFLTAREAQLALDYLQKIYPRLPRKGSRLSHKFIIWLYNISPVLSKWVLVAMGRMVRDKSYN